MIRIQPSRAEVTSTGPAFNAVPVHAGLVSDDLTPVSAFTRLAEGSAHAFLLESVIGGEKIARYSFLGSDPVAVHTASGSETGDPLMGLAHHLSKVQAVPSPELPRFLGGAVGYAGYDIARHYEKVGRPARDDRGLPEMQFGIYEDMVVFDHVRKLIHIVANATVDESRNWSDAYDRACHRIETIVDRLGRSCPSRIRPVLAFDGPAAVNFDRTFTQADFESAVGRCKQFIRAGDAFQIVLSQRLSALTKAPPFEIYRALRVIAPSPFMFYLQTPSVTLVGSSPEVLCRIEGRTVSTRPLAGTRPRGRTEAEDRGLETELLADPKERAEHVMLVDLGRNDLARVCEPGSVRVDELMTVERFSHVMHICSHVSGTLEAGKTAFDALRSVLPVGTVSGAPKIRAMQIIDEIEPVRRGPYAGAVGYIDFAGNMDTCIALRTLVITPEAVPGGDGSLPSRWRVDAQVGAGIVADSEPEREYQETLNKARGMLAALQMADEWRPD